MKKNWYKGVTATAITLAMAGAAFTVPALAIDYDLNYGDVHVGSNDDGTVWSGQTQDGGNSYFHYETGTDGQYKFVSGKYQHTNSTTGEVDTEVNISQGFVDSVVNTVPETTVPENGTGFSDFDQPVTDPEITDNTVTVSGDLTGNDTDETNDVQVTISDVTVDTNETFLTVEEGSKADITISDSTIKTDGNGIEIGKPAEDTADTGTDVDLTLDNTNIILDTVGNVAGVYEHDDSNVDLTLKGDNTITADKEAIENVIASGDTTNKNINGIRVGGSVADSSKGDADLTVNGEGSLTISNTGSGIVIGDESSATITDGAEVNIEDTITVNSTGAGRGINQYGDLTISGGASVNIDGVYEGKVTVDNDGDGWTSSNYGYGIDSYKDINVDGGTLTINDVSNGVYVHNTSSVNVTNGGTLNISNADSNGMMIENNSEGVFVDNANLNISDSGAGIYALGGQTSIEFKNGAQVTMSGLSSNAIGSDGNNATGHILVDGQNTKFVAQNIDSTAFAGNFAHITVSNGAEMRIENAKSGITLGATTENFGGAYLHVTNGGKLIMTGIENDGIGTAKDWHEINVTDNGKIEISGKGNGIHLENDNTLINVSGGTLNLWSDNAGILVAGGTEGNELNEGANSHIEATNGIYGADYTAGMDVKVMGGTLSYDFSKDYTFWPENSAGDRLTNFIVDADAEHADFIAYYIKFLDGSAPFYDYLCDLNKENDTMSIWVTDADIRYVVDTDAVDEDLLGKILDELTEKGYDFEYNYPDGEIVVTDKVINGHSLNFTMNNGKLVWADYDSRSEGKATAHDLVYGTSLKIDDTDYVINWYIPNYGINWAGEHPEEAEGTLHNFDLDTNVLVYDVADGMAKPVKVYGALETVPVDPPVDPEPPVIDPEYPEYPELPDYDPPEVDIDDPDVPLVEEPEEPEEPEQPTEEIDDEETPLTPSIPDEVVDEIIAEIEDEVTPLTSVPKTGADEMPAAAALPAGVLAAAVAAMVRKIRRKG